MTLTRRHALGAGALAAAAPFGRASAADPPFPANNRPVTLISNFAPGGIVQKAMLDFQPFFEKELGTRVLIDTVDGAAGLIGYNQVYGRPADGYYILPCSSTFGPYIYPYLSKAQPPWAYKDWVPLGIYSDIPNSGMVVLKDSPIRTFPDLVRTAKERPGKLTIGTIGPGRVEDVQIIELQKFFDITVNHVFYDSGGTLFTDLLTGDLDVIITAAIEYAQLDTVRIFTMLAKSLPDNFPYKQLKTMADWQDELHYKVGDLKTLGATQFNGLVVKAGLPGTAYDRLVLALKNTAANPEWKARVAAYRYPVYYDPGQSRQIYDGLFKAIGELVGKPAN